MKNNNIVADKSKLFALRIIRMYQYLCEEKKEYVLAKQVLRSGTSIGANAKEAAYAQSTADFYAKMSIALKEAAETEYWIELLYESGYLCKGNYESIYHDCQELIKLLVSICKTTQANIRKK